MMESFGGASCPPILEDVVSALAPRIVPSRYSLDHLLNAWVSEQPVK